MTTTAVELHPPAARRSQTGSVPFLALSALGVVFGDIGTSPLYAFKLCFGAAGAATTPANILGLLSLIFWTLVVVVCVKYVGFMMRADNHGEGGIIALLALLSPRRASAMPLALGGIAVTAVIGAAMLYGDGAITPAISVISALEGLEMLSTSASAYVVPLSVVVLAGLFLAQRFGTDRIGRSFGPVMLVWLFAIGLAGLIGIAQHPGVLVALSPVYALNFFVHGGLHGVLVFSAVVLAVTGVEALYADLGHFCRKPITVAWYAIAFPTLALNYFGQGAIMLGNPKVDSPFFALFPGWTLIPIVLLATAATVIASQALISGVFSLTSQLMQLGFAPRFQILHTSKRHVGQIYLPTVNAMLAIACILLVVTFRSSDALGGAYGLAVNITMIATSLIFYAFLRKIWNWHALPAAAVVGLFLLWDGSFLIGNASKILTGGWVPLLIGGALTITFTTWNIGRRRVIERIRNSTLPLSEFGGDAKETTPNSGTAVFFTPEPTGVPFVRTHRWLRQYVAQENIIILSILSAAGPFVSSENRVQVERAGDTLYEVRASYGFMQQASIHDILRHVHERVPQLDLTHVTYYLADPQIVRSREKGALPLWQRTFFAWISRNARPMTDYLGLPGDNVIRVGVETPI